MSVLEKGLKKAGLKLEAELNDRLSESEHQLNDSLRASLDLQEENTKIKVELMQLKLKDRMTGMDTLTVADRARMLECTSIGAR